MDFSKLQSPPNQPAKFVELFYDIIFVFSVVQLVEILHGHFDVDTVSKVLILFWLVWWSWSQFTWTLNGADTESDFIEFSILVVTAISFFMAISIPNAFTTSGMIFAIAWATSRGIGLVIYFMIASSFGEKTVKVLTVYSAFSFVSIIFVILGPIFGGTLQYIFWIMVVIIDISGALYAGKFDGWVVHTEHFCERHGLFMIIVLGETLIINASGLTEGITDNKILTLGIMAVLVTLTLWWSYFAHLRDEIGKEMEKLGDFANNIVARDSFSLLHYPIFLGVIAYASALEDIVLHPHDLVSFSTKLSFVVGITLYLSGLALAVYRANGQILYHRYIMSILISGVILLYPNLYPHVILIIIFTGVTIVNILEELKLFTVHTTDSKHLDYEK